MIKRVERTYILLTLLNTLAASFIWGINTLFLLDAGLSNGEAFGANAFFTVGTLLFEVPTGVIADTTGRRRSYLLGSATLMISTLMYYYMWVNHAGFAAFCFASLVLGLGFTFFSGAVEAWLVDALSAHGFKGELEDVFSKGQITSGVAMLTGSSLGGVVAQYTNLGVPYILRAGFLVLSFFTALFLMKDEGFNSRKIENYSKEMKEIFLSSLQLGFHQKNIRWMVLTAPFITGSAVYAFYAAQPYLLELYGDKSAFWIAGLASSLVAGAQILGGLSATRVRKLFKKRTVMLGTLYLFSSLCLISIPLFDSFIGVFFMLAGWALFGSTAYPVRQAYLNNCLPSNKRATLLSFDGLVGSAGGVFSQPTLGRIADIYGYGVSLLFAGFFQFFLLIFLRLTNKEKSPADIITSK